MFQGKGHEIVGKGDAKKNFLFFHKVLCRTSVVLHKFTHKGTRLYSIEGISERERVRVNACIWFHESQRTIKAPYLLSIRS